MPDSRESFTLLEMFVDYDRLYSATIAPWKRSRRPLRESSNSSIIGVVKQLVRLLKIGFEKFFKIIVMYRTGVFLERFHFEYQERKHTLSASSKALSHLSRV